MPSALRFRYDKVLDELRSFDAVFTKFCSPNGEPSKSIWERLQAARDSTRSGSCFEWIIGDPNVEEARQRPIRTTTSLRNVEGAEWPAAYAEFFMLWRLEQGVSTKRNEPPAEFVVRSASSVCKIWEEVNGEKKRVAEWTFDIGDVTAPGCRFHLHPDYRIEIPRFPSLCVLPNDALACLANELFPKSWPVAVAGSSEAKFHGPKQSQRLRSLLNLWSGAADRSNDPFGEIVMFREYSPLSVTG